MNEQQKLENDVPSKAGFLGNKLLLEKLQIAIAIMVPVFGTYASFQANQAARTIQQVQVEIQERKDETERVQEFTKRIQEQLPNLAGGDTTKAKIALASLYSLAKEESDKSILYTIAIVSEKEAMKNTIKDLILEDSDASTQFKEQIREKLSKRATVNGPATGVVETPLQKSVENGLLQQLTQQSENKVVGWIYLGKTRFNEKTLESGRTIKSNQIPSKDTIIETITAINLRNSAPNARGLGAVKGGIAENSKLKVEDIKRVKIDANYDAIWAQISQNSSS